MSSLQSVSRIKPQKELTLDDLLTKVGEYLAPEKQEAISRAFAYALECHQGQLRKSGESFVQHPIHTAYLVADLRLDANTLAAALLHDVPEDCGIPLEEVGRRFGPEVQKLVDGVTKLSRIELLEPGAELSHRRVYRHVSQAENLRRMFLAMAEDVRVVIIKLADRLHNMRTLQALSPQKRREIARETFEIYAPLASRLGIWQFKWELEDLSFRYLEPERYKEVARFLAARRAVREEYIEQVCSLLRTTLEEAGIKADVSGRPKHLYSIHQKMQKYASQGKDAGQIYDILALRVLVESISDCYHALGVVHSLWRPLPNTFDDYISMPKESGYQSLHTTVMCLGAQPVEVQIRTHEMHRVAEYGVAAHWRYKEGGSKDLDVEAKLSWLRQLLEWQRDLQGAEEFVESVKTDLFNDQVFVFTPKGEIKDLPAGATPLDFAYRVHTDLGHRCIGSKVNGRLVPLNQPLKTGDMVEILTGKGERGPRLDWLNFNLGYLKTTHAREKVRQWYRRQERGDNVERGRELLKRELSRLGLSMTDLEVAQLFKYDNAEEFLAALGYGDVNAGAIGTKLAAQQERPLVSAPTAPSPEAPAKGIRVLGVGDLLTRLAACCHPVPGDQILGYITRTRGVTVHRKSCPNLVNEDEKERLIPVEWGAGGQMYAVPIRITAIDRVGLLRDIAATVSAEKINIVETSQAAQPDGTAHFHLVLETTGMSQLSRVLARIEGIAGVTSVARTAEKKGPVNAG